MRTSIQCTRLTVRTTQVVSRRATAAVLVAASLTLSFVALRPAIAVGEESKSDTKAEEKTSSDSVVVASRARISPQVTPPSTGPTGPAIEPIAEDSDHRPEKADLDDFDTEAEAFGAGLADMRADNADAAQQPPADLVTVDCSKIKAEPAKFNGIQPGTSTRTDVVAAWGEPTDRSTLVESEVYSYNSPPFRAVEVLLTADLVDAIKIELAEPVASADLAKQLTIDKIAPVDVTDEQGKLLGRMFPERGVLFMCDEEGSESKITHVVIQPLDANAFALRAENRLHGPYESNIRDLRFALALDPELAHARWLLADIYLANGQGNLAESESAKAMNLDPKNAAYHLRWAQSLTLLGRYDEAAKETRAVLENKDTPPVVKAQALHHMAILAGLGEAQIAKKAIEFENEAIKIADKLATSGNTKERRAAKELLIEAHLNIAQEIAIQPYQNKLRSISEWIGRASGLAEDYIKTDGGSVEWRLRVAQQSLGALAQIKTDKNPAPWVAEAQSAADALAKQWDDPLWHQRVQWEVGEAYVYAAQIEHMRMKTAPSLRYGQLAIENLAEGAKSRQATPECEQLVGRLYFYIGAVHAIHNLDHEKAVLWYDRAAPLLTSPRPVSELSAPRRDGEELVSMGLSYWQTEQQQRALELTKAGTALIEQAVDAKRLEKTALAVPYGNLASMYRQAGDDDNAVKYADLARVAGAKRPQRTATPGTRSRTSQIQPASTQARTARPSTPSASSAGQRSQQPRTASRMPSNQSTSMRAVPNRPSTTRSSSTAGQPTRTRTMPTRTTTSGSTSSKSAKDLSTAAKSATTTRPSPHDTRTLPSTDASSTR